MPGNKRWMTSVLKEAAQAQIKMPWARGATRAEMIEKRLLALKAARKTASA